MCNRMILCVSVIVAVILHDQVKGEELAHEMRPNLLIVTVDDMSADSLGVYDCRLPDTSPSIDRFARSAMRFEHAHVQVGNCMPGRNIMWSGMYAHKNGIEGFVQNQKPNYPVLCDLAQSAGYFAAIRGKVSHSTPYTPYRWDAVLDRDSNGHQHHVKDPKSYGESTRQGIALARQQGKPFCLMINISDPHKPFYSPKTREGVPVDPFTPSRVFVGEEVPIPGFLFDDPDVRQELALYYSSVRRADDAFSEIMDALNRSGEQDRTVVLFCSDHGMPLPFAKTQLYYHSTRTPLMVRWPGVTTPGYVDHEHMVSAIDFLPTLLELMGHKHPEPERLDGRSFAPLLRGESQTGRDHVILQYNENSGGNRHPMRGLVTKTHLYLFNPWSDGHRRFATATTGTMSYRRMRELAVSDAFISRRLMHFDHRVREEFYELASDSDCRENLIGYTEQQQNIEQARSKLASELLRIGDPVGPLLFEIENAKLVTLFMEQEDQRSREHQERKRADRFGNKKSVNELADKALIIACEKNVHTGSDLKVNIKYNLPSKLGRQKIQVTLKYDSKKSDLGVSEKLERKIISVQGAGEAVVTFHVPDQVLSNQLRVAAFVGEEFSTNRIYKVSDRILVSKD